MRPAGHHTFVRGLQPPALLVPAKQLLVELDSQPDEEPARRRVRAQHVVEVPIRETGHVVPERQPGVLPEQQPHLGSERLAQPIVRAASHDARERSEVHPTREIVTRTAGHEVRRVPLRRVRERLADPFAGILPGRHPRLRPAIIAMSRDNVDRTIAAGLGQADDWVPFALELVSREQVLSIALAVTVRGADPESILQLVDEPCGIRQLIVVLRQHRPVRRQPLRVYSAPKVAAVACSPALRIGSRRSSPVDTRRPSRIVHAFLSPIAACASRPEIASFMRYSENNSPADGYADETPSTVRWLR